MVSIFYNYIISKALTYCKKYKEIKLASLNIMILLYKIWFFVYFLKAPSKMNENLKKCVVAFEIISFFVSFSVTQFFVCLVLDPKSFSSFHLKGIELRHTWTTNLDICPWWGLPSLSNKTRSLQNKHRNKSGPNTHQLITPIFNVVHEPFGKI